MSILLPVLIVLVIAFVAIVVSGGDRDDRPATAVTR